MPQVNSASSICLEKTDFGGYLFSLGDNKSNVQEPKINSQSTIQSDEYLNSHVTENDSGFATSSDEEDRLNSGSSEDSNPNNSLSSVLHTTESLDFWNKASIKANDIKDPPILKSFDKNSHIKFTPDDISQDNCAALPDDVTSFLNLLSNSSENYSEGKSSLLTGITDMPTLIKNETTTEDVLNFYELLNDKNVENDYKMVNALTLPNKSIETYDKDNKSYSNSSNNLINNFDNSYSDLLTSILDNKGSDNSNYIENNDVSIDNGESLSDLLASICIENNDTSNNSFSKPISTNSGLKPALDIDTNDISLASLAEVYLASSASNNFYFTTQNNDFTDLLENDSLNYQSETLNKDSSEKPINMCDLFTAVNNEHSNSVASFAEKCMHNEDFSEDATDSNIEIDLTACLKSDIPSASPSDSHITKNEEIIHDADSDMPHLCSSPSLLMSNPTGTDSPLLKNKRKKMKQSLFAKALSCKPRRDKEAILKVMNIQKQFCENIFNPPFQNRFMKPVKSMVCPASDFVVSTLSGRRFFERGKYHEVK